MSDRDRIHPPRAAERILRLLLGRGADGSSIVGDLHEEFCQLARASGPLRARLWYWRQVAITGLSYSRPGRKTLDRVLHDLRFAFRGIVKEPGFASTVVITMALGIGAGTAIFSFVDGMLLRPLPFPQPDRLVRVWASPQSRDDPYVDLMYGDVRAFASGVPSFTSVTGLSLASRVLMDDRAENRENVVVARTTASFFETLGVTPVLGRVYTEAEARRGEQIVLISHELWERRYGATPDAIGSLLHLDVRAFRIVGVLPQGVEYPEDAQVWRALSPDEMQDDDREVHVVARLGPEATVSAANAAEQRVWCSGSLTRPRTPSAPIRSGSSPRNSAHSYRAMFLKTTPPFITKTTRRTAVMSSSGLPTTATRSAS